MVVIVRYSEIGLKGRNRHIFEKRLVGNIKDAFIKNNSAFDVIKRPRGRILIYTNDKCGFLQRVFGIASFSYAFEASGLREAEEISEKLTSLLSKSKTFRITCQRLDKRFSLNANALERELGAFVQKVTGAKVKLKGADFELCAEIIEGKIYLFTKKTAGFGGLPIGVSSRMLSLIENDASLLASLMMMNRGAEVVPIALTKKNIGLLKKYAYGCEMKLSLIKDTAEIDSLAKDLNAKALIVSQTLNDFEEFNIDLQILRPLIACSKKEIEAKLNDYRADD